MRTIQDIIAEALYEADAIPGDLAELNVEIDTTPGASTIKVEAEWAGAYVPARRYGRLAGPAEWEEEQGEDTAEWDGETNPAEIIADLFGFIDDDVWRDQEPLATIYLPAAAVDHILGWYAALGYSDEPVVMFDDNRLPHAAAVADYYEWHSAMRKVIAARPPAPARAHNGDNPHRAPTPGCSAFTAGMWAGVDLAEALTAAARLDANLAANGHPPAFVWLTTPRALTADDVAPGFAARLEAAYGAVALLDPAVTPAHVVA